MEKIGEIEIRVTGKMGNKDLRPDTYDIKEIIVVLQNVEDLLNPLKKKDRPVISHELVEGSVRHIFKTSIQTIIGFSAILTQVEENQSIGFLELNTARAIENIQKISRQKNYEFRIKTSLKEGYELTINPKTNFFQIEDSWVDAELYFYGILKDAGGKNKANIHLDTRDYGYLSIETGEVFLKEREENLLYKEFGVRAIGKQNSVTGEIDTKSLKLVELIDYKPKYDEEYLKGLVKRAKNNWKDIDPDEWLFDLRGGYEA